MLSSTVSQVMTRVTDHVTGHGREIASLVSLLTCTFCMVALVGFDPLDPTPFNDELGVVTNPCGPVGAVLSHSMLLLVGYGAWLSFGLMAVSFLALAHRRVGGAFEWTVGSTLFLSVLTGAHMGLPAVASGAYEPGGVVGATLATVLTAAVGQAGACLAVAGGVLTGVTLLGGLRWNEILVRVVDRLEKALPILLAWVGASVRSFGSLTLRGTVYSAKMAKRASLATMGLGWRAVKGVSRLAGRMGSALLQGPIDPYEEWAYESDIDAMDPSSFGSELQDARPLARREPTSPTAEVEWTPSTPGVEAEVEDSFFNSAVDVSASPPGVLVAERPAQHRLPTTAEMLSLFPTLRARGEPVPPPMRAPVRSPDAGTSGPTELMTHAVARVVVPQVAASPAPKAAVAPFVEGELKGFGVHKSDFLDREVDDDGRALASVAEFELPPLNLLNPVPKQHATIDEIALREMAEVVETSLRSFRVTGDVKDVRVGPVVTTLEFLPGQGISVRRIANLSADLAMALKAMSVRIVAPIPGKGVVGIEIPSNQRLTIYLREMLASPEFRETKHALPCILGKSVDGRPVIADLAKMPHLLVGGTTGSGKSVGVNGMLMSMLYTRTPEELRMILIDPKKLEFDAYADIPHLLHPIVTEPKMAAAALSWACREMDRRYEVLRRWKVRNLAGYNKKVRAESKKWSREKALQYAPKDWNFEDLDPPRTLPYIVVVIDELADLMMVAKKDVQDSIVRLAQMARACGIHLVIATQRPSVDVITGLIKSNMPTRIAFKLRSVIDSRTILDQGGAETLLGMGDMLYLPGAGEVSRCHGAFVADEEVHAVMAFLRAQGEPDYIHSVMPDEDSMEFDFEDRDEYYDQALELVVNAGKASTSMIQRHLKIGYNRAARIVDLLESTGVVGPPDGARPREVLIRRGNS